MDRTSITRREEEQIQRLRPCLAECTVLLRRNGDFPLEAPGKIALYGSGVRHTIKGGTGSGEVNSRYFVTVEEGFEQAGFTVTSKAWLDGYDRVVEQALAAFRRQLKAEAKARHTNVMMLAMGATVPEPEYTLPLDGEGETAIYVLSRISGEGADRKPVKGDILLTDTEQRDILALQHRYKRFLLVLNVGGMVDLSPLGEVSNILLLSQLGVETGNTLADLVLGRQVPSGKLTDTWTAWKDQLPMMEFGGYDDTPYREGIYVGYRYYDTVGQEVLFPFGFGLGYTDFALDQLHAELEGTHATVTARLTNTGRWPGKEVAQLYLSKPEGVLDQPVHQLAGWAKTALLQPGQSETVTIPLDLSELASYDPARAAYLLEAGDYLLQVGCHSRDTRPVAVLRLPRTVLLCQVRNALGTPPFADWKPDRKPVTAEGVPVMEVDPDAFSLRTVDYQTSYPIDPKAKALRDEELALLSNGAFGGGGLATVVGSAATSVCGAAGETARVTGFPPIVMADGPAGIRIHQRYFRDKKGLHSMEAPFPQSMVPFMPPVLKFLMDHFLIKKPRRPEDVRYQYCTALPIGTALAQSWNTEIAELCGDVVGREMEIFGVDLWLAPALNIHRSPLCGRNFEYFSEDPLISGRFAAAVTRGVQQHPGRGVTIKHFAANNQEFNRTSSNSQVSERAMREIYLRGFQICVAESDPKALMTSYNLLNGQHTSTRRDLIEDILRCEFGFRGLVMTDWVVRGGMIPKDAKYPGPQPWEVAAAGGDLFMPGSKADYNNVLQALKTGKLSRTQLEINATRLLRFGKK